nr:hypothetical protein [Tanacetum cinerariifolium]
TWQLRQHRSMPVNDDQRRQPPVNGGGSRWWITVVIGGQRWRLTTIAGGEAPLTAAGPPLTTTGPPINCGWWAGQRSGLGRVRARSGPGPPCGMPRVSHVCTRVSHVCPRGS